MRRRFKRRRRLRFPHIVAVGAAAYVLVTGVRALAPHDPCAAINWIAERDIPTLTGSSLIQHWPEPSEYADLVAGVDAGAISFRSRLSGERDVEISDTCLILDRPDEARIRWDRKNGFTASLVSPAGLSAPNVVVDTIEGTRIGIRTAIGGRVCTPSLDGPSAVLLAQLFDGIHSRKDVADALGERLGDAHPVSLNEDIYRTSLISPRNYFESKQILTYLVREGDNPLLINAYLENTAERVIDYGSGTFAVFEIIDLRPIAARLAREQHRCEVGPERGPLPRLAL
ncbi:MAG: hypothetical protein AAGC81_05350 [Pseudomonadota bacterium]